MGFVRDMIRKVRRIEQLNEEQTKNVSEEAAAKDKVVAKQREIDAEIRSLKETRAYQDAARRAQGQ